MAEMALFGEEGV